MHLQILSVVTGAQLRRIFERRTNFDLRRLLNGSVKFENVMRHSLISDAGAETFMTALLDRLEFDLAMSTSSLRCLKLDPTIRIHAAEALVPTSKMKVSLTCIYDPVQFNNRLLGRPIHYPRGERECNNAGPAQETFNSSIW